MSSIVATNGTTGRRFELPALDFKFAPLTDGTTIPPPLPSPVEETPPPPPPPAPAPASVPAPAPAPAPAPVTAARAETPDAALHRQNDQAPGAQASPQSRTGGTKRPADSPISPVSPTLSARPNSIRRLFSRNLLNASYAEGEQEPDSPGGLRRPQSQASIATTATDKRPKRSSGWFRRLRGGPVTADATEVKRATIGSYEDLVAASARKPLGPPPPMIPEISDLEAKVGLRDGSSFGTDLFKDIK